LLHTFSMAQIRFRILAILCSPLFEGKSYDVTKRKPARGGPSKN
jgi:hypothetical protein